MSNVKATIKQLKGDYRFGGLDMPPIADNTNWSLLEMGGYAPPLATKDFRVSNVPETKDQLRTDFCVAFEGSYTVEQDIRSTLAAAYNFAMAKKRYHGGDYSGFGLRITDGLGSLQHDGICLEELYPFSGTRSRNNMANWRNIPDAAHKDAKTRKLDKGYFKVDIYNDKFDNFCAAMLHWNEMIITGMQWYSGYYIDSRGRLVMNKRGSRIGHCVSAIERKTIDGIQGIVFKNSYKNKPEFWMSADDVRREMYFGYIVLPFKKDIAKIIKKHAGKAISVDSKNIYLVIDGHKRLFESELSAWAHNVQLRSGVNYAIPVDEFDVIPEGEPINQKDGKVYPILKEVFTLQNQRFDELKQLINN